MSPPLEPLYIGTALEGVGWAVDFRDFRLDPGASPFDVERSRGSQSMTKVGATDSLCASAARMSNCRVAGATL
jgi:hypothetical protein